MVSERRHLDLWERLALLHQCCEVVIDSFGGPSGNRLWRIVARSRSDRNLSIDVTGSSFLDAVVQALDEAQAHRLDQAPSSG